MDRGWFSVPSLLAQQEGASIWAMLIPMLAIVFLFYFLLIVPQRKEQRKRQEMLAALKKNDRVITIGGIYGVVTNVHREADEVTLKVDEATNTKIRVSLNAIARVLQEAPSEEEK
ncbi:MAG: preprotein translocase subunit YajC [Thermoguttaceae bacterium]|nr:preprotein translocase subunit YajC [Thermoguttaceae bacterium]MDW8037945.1 preprotein translocase subunit YajC [Thermoguttaceae bacterium]